MLIAITPDLRTRESVMAAAGRVQLSVTTPEGTRYVKIEAKIKDQPGSSKRYTAASLEDATHVFVSEKGYGTTSLGTYYPSKGTFYENDRVQISREHLQAMTWAIDFINGEPIPPTVEVVAESRCGMCGRGLEDPESVKRGIGPECASKPTGTKILHASVFAAQAPLPTAQRVRVDPAVIEEAERVSAALAADPDAVVINGHDVTPPPVSHEDNNCDRATVEVGVDVQGLTTHQLAVLTAAVAEENAIRAHRPTVHIERLGRVLDEVRR